MIFQNAELNDGAFNKIDNIKILRNTPNIKNIIHIDRSIIRFKFIDYILYIFLWIFLKLFSDFINLFIFNSFYICAIT